MADDDHDAANGGGAPSNPKGAAPAAPDQISNVIDFASIQPTPGMDKLEEWAAEVARLAALPPHEYDRVRKERAKEWKVRAPTLDKAVALARPKDTANQGQGRPIVFEDPEPWEDPVDGAEVLDAVASTITRHVVLRQHDDVKAALWTAHTYCYRAFFNTPRLAVTSPEKECGKSTLFDVLAELCLRPKTSEGLTAAVVYRLVDLAHPCLLLDEADAWLIEGEDLRAVIDSGHKATGSIQRNVEVGGEWVPREFSSFCPVAIAAIRRGSQRLPATIESRSISIKMRRALRGEAVQGFRPDRAHAALEPIRQKLARFAADNMDALRDTDPVMPPGAFNRFADNWRPLVAIADAAGGRWPAAARAALLADLVGAKDDALGHQLLEDVRTVFDTYVDADTSKIPASKLASSTIVGALHEMDDRPWKEVGKQARPLTQNMLARLLKDFEIMPHGAIRLPNGKTPKGYLRSAFEDAWKRYLSPEGGIPTATPPQPKDPAGFSDSATATNSENVAVANRRKPRQTATCGGVAVEKGGSGEEDKKSNGPEPETVASVPFMITWQMRADLRARGFTDAQIRAMTPEQAHECLKAHTRARGTYPELRELCQQAVAAKGNDAVAEIFQRLGVTRLSDAAPDQVEQVRDAVEQLLNGAD
jgi:putative DNA primase/helicase